MAATPRLLSSSNIFLALKAMVEKAKISRQEVNLTVPNGKSSNLAISATAEMIVVKGPNADFSIGGIAGGVTGRYVQLINVSGYNMTFLHRDTGSTQTNQLSLPGATNLVVPNFGSVELFYSEQGGNYWFRV